MLAAFIGMNFFDIGGPPTIFAASFFAIVN